MTVFLTSFLHLRISGGKQNEPERKGTEIFGNVGGGEGQREKGYTIVRFPKHGGQISKFELLTH